MYLTDRDDVVAGLDSNMHLSMLRQWQRGRTPIQELARRLGLGKHLYGLHWGDPDTVPPLQFVRDHYLLPFVHPRQKAVEIGPGGGRWTRYLLGFETVFAIDHHSEVLAELRRNFRRATNLETVCNSGTDFPGLARGSVDYVFSFGTFVHFDFDVIESYFRSLQAIVKPGANIIIQYSDKTKVMAQMNKGFSENDPARMRTAVRTAGYEILEEDTTTLWHSSIIRFTYK